MRKIFALMLAIAMVLTTIIASLGMNTLWLSILFKKGFLVMLPGRLVTSISVGIINTIVLGIMLNMLKNKV